jgi:hypothetical protein
MATQEQQMICDLCGKKTHDDQSEVFLSFFSKDGVTQQRHCFDCDPPDEELN